MVVWGDLLFLINFSMDFLCFYICCRLLHQRLPTGRGALASFLGGIYSVVALFAVTQKWVAFIFDILVLCVMCLCVFAERKMSFLRFLRLCGLYFLVSALLGGVMTALFSLFNRVEMLVGDMGIEEGIDVWIFAVLALISIAVTLRGGRIFRISSAKDTVTLEIEDGSGEKVRLTALVDSGNGAVEPISGKGVIFADLYAMRGVLDSEIYSALACGEGVEKLPLRAALRIRLVPTGTVGGRTILPAVHFKNVKLITKKRTKSIDVYIALLNGGELSPYDAIISHEATI